MITFAKGEKPLARLLEDIRIAISRLQSYENGDDDDVDNEGYDNGGDEADLKYDNDDNDDVYNERYDDNDKKADAENEVDDNYNNDKGYRGSAVDTSVEAAFLWKYSTFSRSPASLQLFV